MSKTIVDEYIKRFEGMIIAISGLSCTCKSKIAKDLAKIFNITHINLNKYYKQDYNNEIELDDNGTKKKIKNVSVDEIIDWEIFNTDVSTAKLNGVMISGLLFPTELIKFTIDFHLHISVKKQSCLEKRIDYQKKNNKTDYTDPFFTIYFNTIEYPYYEESIKRSMINKFINLGKMSRKDLMDKSFDLFIDFIYLKIYGKKREILTEQSHTSNENIKSNEGGKPKKKYNKRNIKKN